MGHAHVCYYTVSGVWIYGWSPASSMLMLRVFVRVVAALGCKQVLPFPWTELWQMPENGDKRPQLLIAVGGSKGGHTGGHDPIGDDPEQRAIAGVLDGGCGQRWRFGGEMPGKRLGLHLGSPVAHETHLRIVTQPPIKHLRLRSHGIGHCRGMPGNRPCCRKGQHALKDGRGVCGGDIDESRPDDDQACNNRDNDGTEKATAEAHGTTLPDMI